MEYQYVGKHERPATDDDFATGPITLTDLEALVDLPERPRIVALVPAHNESEGIGSTIQSLLDQERPLDEIVVISDNSVDDTVAIAHKYNVTVLETEGNTHRKSGALNQGWHEYGADADIIVCADGDTQLPPHAVRDWELEFQKDPGLGGSSSQPVMMGNGFLPRLQRLEFSKSAAMSLNRGWCRVVSGTGCAYRGEALREIALLPEQPGPWTYQSVVEDYHLTYQLRRAGWLCNMSPTVWCCTGSMTSIKALWHQRIKWEAGTQADLLQFGFNRLNYREWLQRGFLFLSIAFWVIWWALNGTTAVVDHQFAWGWWWAGIAVLFSVTEGIQVKNERFHDKWDYLISMSLLQMTVYTFLAVAWGTVSWYKVLSARMGDLWAPQYKAEGMTVEKMEIGV
jgi:poly-beta-1,6-N-acetyl-D-glucosamine synthase